MYFSSNTCQYVDSILLIQNCQSIAVVITVTIYGIVLTHTCTLLHNYTYYQKQAIQYVISIHPASGV